MSDKPMEKEIDERRALAIEHACVEAVLQLGDSYAQMSCLMNNWHEYAAILAAQEDDNE